MLTATGIEVLPGNDSVPTPRDLAVAMGRICRFGGAVWAPLLAHSVMVGELVRRQLESENALEAELDTWAWSLLHDAHEVVMGEIPRPWKNGGRKLQEVDLDIRLARKFGINLDLLEHDVIKHADEISLRCEAVILELPNFQERYAAQNGLDRFPMPHEDELTLYRRITLSGLYRSVMSTYASAAEVVMFSEVLALIRDGNPGAGLMVFNDLLRWQNIR